MFPTLRKISVLATIGLLSYVLAAPAPQLVPANEGTGAVAGETPTAVPTATTTSGPLFGSESLLGEVYPPTPIDGTGSSGTGDNSAIVSNYALVNGQEADPKLGLYLDFNSVPNPQPIRGSGGQTIPDPSKQSLCAVHCDQYH